MADARKVARWIVVDIVDDILGRKGIGNELEEIDEEVKQEMITRFLTRRRLT